MKCPKQTIQVFLETSHDKSKSNGLGGVFKWHVSQDVAAKEVVIRNRKEWFDYCEKNSHGSGRRNEWENDESSVYVHFCNGDERILRRIPWKM